jgi:hypothetical protein
MAAPLYFQVEIDPLLLMEKRAVFESWLRPSKKEKRRRHNEFEEVGNISIEADPPASGIAFAMDICRNLRTDAIAITLYAEIHPRPLIPICRYDVHDTPHPNPPWFPPPLIESGVYHRHVYNERAIVEGDPDDWCKCAEVLQIAPGGSPQVQLQRLRLAFIGDMKIRFEETDTLNEFLDFGQRK